jgi:hypothetical protein
MKNSNLFKSVLTLAVLLSASSSLLSQSQRNACWTTQTGNIGNVSIYACNNGTTVATADTLFVRHAVTIGSASNQKVDMSSMAFDIISLENGATLTPYGTNNELTLPKFSEINILAGSSIVQPGNNSVGNAIRILNNTGSVCAWGTACCTGNKSINGPALLTYTDPCAYTVALPVTMVDFKGYVKNEVVNLTWLVTDEKELSRYVVYSSVDGINFNLCGSVNATSASAGIKTYQYADYNNKSTLVYYKIKMINNDETGEWSTIVALHTAKPVTNKPLKSYPNPATDVINIKFDGAVPVNFSLLLMDMSGKVVLESNGVEASSDEYSLPLNGLVSGMYIIKLSDELGNTFINRFNIK